MSGNIEPTRSSKKIHYRRICQVNVWALVNAHGLGFYSCRPSHSPRLDRCAQKYTLVRQVDTQARCESYNLTVNEKGWRIESG
ncbi:hypothetical protein SRABI91_02614 [Rhodococcoides fascians]|nr:hypothetical protein SRABI91_02614 [Rhodococcus fascians]